MTITPHLESVPNRFEMVLTLDEMITAAPDEKLTRIVPENSRRFGKVAMVETMNTW